LRIVSILINILIFQVSRLQKSAVTMTWTWTGYFWPPEALLAATERAIVLPEQRYGVGVGHGNELDEGERIGDPSDQRAPSSLCLLPYWGFVKSPQENFSCCHNRGFDRGNCA